MEDFNFEIIDINSAGTVKVVYTPDDVTLDTRTHNIHADYSVLADPDPAPIKALVSSAAPQQQWAFEKDYEGAPTASQQHLGVVGDETDIPPVLPAVAAVLDLDNYTGKWERIYTDGASLNSPSTEDGVVKIESSGNTSDLVQVWRSLESDLCYNRRHTLGVWYPWREVLMRKEGYNIVEQNFTAGKPKFGSEPEWVTLPNGLCAYEFNIGETMCSTMVVPADYLYGTPVDLAVFFHLKSVPQAGQTVTWRASFMSGRCNQGSDMLAAPIVIDVTYTCDGTEQVGELLCDNTGEVVYLAPPGAILVYNLELLSDTVAGNVIVAHTTRIAYKTNQAFSTMFPM